MTVIRSFIIAFSMYSKIPMPQFPWEEKDMRYVMIFFPMVGLVIGGLTWIWWQVTGIFQINDLARCCIGLFLPLLISGGIHVDGYMDTMDALNSYQDRSKKLEILKDAHIGAFCVIRLAGCGLVYLAAYSMIQGKEGLIFLMVSFYLTRILSAMAVVTFPCAKKEGTLYLFSSRAQERIVKAALVVQLLICGAILIWCTRLMAAGYLVTAGLIFFYYYKKMNREFGGITGDTAGYFVVHCETWLTVAAAVISVAVIAV